jgi:hypothetical protein
MIWFLNTHLLYEGKYFFGKRITRTESEQSAVIELLASKEGRFESDVRLEGLGCRGSYLTSQATTNSPPDNPWIDSYSVPRRLMRQINPIAAWPSDVGYMQDYFRSSPVVALAFGGREANPILAGWRDVSSLETNDHQPWLYLMR